MSARANIDWQIAYQRDNWDVVVKTNTQMHCDQNNFYLTGTVKTFEKGKLFCERHFTKTFRRDNV